jgi:hypothetical protein
MTAYLSVDEIILSRCVMHQSIVSKGFSGCSHFTVDSGLARGTVILLVDG